MIRQRLVSFVVGLLSTGILLICTSCDFSTRIVSEADSPGAVLDSFFTELKSENYEQCDKCLADNATFVVKNTSGYDFTEELMEYQMKYLEYKPEGETEFDGIFASQRVEISSPDMDYMIRDMKQSIGSIEYDYIAETQEEYFDNQNSEQVSEVISMAMEKYFKKSGSPKMLDSSVNVSFKYQDGGWKIQVDDQLVAAIFGGKADE